MKTILFAILATLALATSAFAQGSSQDYTTNGTKLFTPDAQYSANVVVGTKGKSANYYNIKAGQSAFKIVCRSADDTVPAGVKIYLNSDSTYPHFLGTGSTIEMGVNNTGKGTATTKIGFATYTTAAAKAVTCYVWGQ